MKTKMMLIYLLGFSLSTLAQHDRSKHCDEKKKDPCMAMFKDAKLGAAYECYVHVKEALVASDTEEVKKAASKLKKALSEVKGTATSIEVAAKIEGSSDLNDQRKLFSMLSNTMTSLVRGKLSMSSIYLDYCPMANNNAGAYWLSSYKEIKNPYFGDAMLKCGAVRETIH